MNEAPDWAMGIHVGSLDSPDGEEASPQSVAQAAVLASIGAPGQILVSDLARALAEPSLPHDLWFDAAGRVALADDRPPEPVFTLRSRATRFVPFPVFGEPSAPTTPPRPGDPFFGRGRELAEIQRAFVEEKERLITLHGPGGIGKTRLAIQAADAVAPALDLAPRWVDLSALEDGQGVALAILEALGAPLDSEQDLKAATLHRLRVTPTLLLIDNAEQVVNAVAGQVHALLQGVPSLRVLVTSRRLLRLSAESAHELGPLPVAEARPEDRPSLAQSDSEGSLPDRTPGDADLDAAASLFVDRAQAAWRNFDAAANADEVDLLCRLLEGIPLAIELAAALAGVLDPSQMITLLEDRFRLLDTTRGSLPKRRDLPERHRSLRAAIDTSWELLSPEARTLFAQAAIFRGGFTLEALAAVSDLPDVFESVAELRDAAMLRAAHGGPMLRYRTLETLREYGLERLRASTSPGEIDAIHERHARHYLQLSEEALPELSPGPAQSLWLRYLDDERENVRVALHWLDGQGRREDTREPVSLGLRMSGALWRYWYERGRLREGRDFIERFLTMAEPEDHSAEHALALHAAGTLSDYIGDPSGALRLLEASLAIRRARIAQFGDTFDDPRLLAYTINNLGNVAQHAGDYVKSATYLEESIALKRATGDVARLYSSLENLAGICMVLGDESGMEEALEEVLEIAEELDQDRVVARVHHLRATDRVHRGDHSGARTLFDAASRILGEHARQVFEAPEHLKNRGMAAHWAGRFDEAARLYDEGLALARELQNRNAESALLRFRGELALDRGRLDEAEALLGEALSFARGDAMRTAASGAQYVLARTLVRRGDLAQAHPLLERSLRFRATLAAPLMLTEVLEAWSEYLAVQGEHDLARRTAGAADRLRREFGFPRPAHQAAAQASTLADAGVAPIDADDPPPEDTEWRGVVTVLLAPSLPTSPGVMGY